MDAQNFLGLCPEEIFHVHADGGVIGQYVPWIPEAEIGGEKSIQVHKRMGQPFFDPQLEKFHFVLVEGRRIKAPAHLVALMRHIPHNVVLRDHFEQQLLFFLCKILRRQIVCPGNGLNDSIIRLSGIHPLHTQGVIHRSGVDFQQEQRHCHRHQRALPVFSIPDQEKRRPDEDHIHGVVAQDHHEKTGDDQLCQLFL